MPSDKTHDAVLCPKKLVKGDRDIDKLLWINSQFGAALGVKSVTVRPMIGEMLLCSGDPIAHRYHAGDHSSAGQERYTWTDRGDGVMYGVLEADDVHA